METERRVDGHNLEEPEERGSDFHLLLGLLLFMRWHLSDGDQAAEAPSWSPR